MTQHDAFSPVVKGHVVEALVLSVLRADHLLRNVTQLQRTKLITYLAASLSAAHANSSHQTNEKARLRVTSLPHISPRITVCMVCSHCSDRRTSAC